MSACLILGGSGYVGSNWAKRLAGRKRFDRIVLADIHPPAQPLAAGWEVVQCDIRRPIQLGNLSPEWIFNFAAVHREPGHAREEYFDTNLAGAKNVCAFAAQSGCKNILFTSSIAVYGSLNVSVSESSLPYPSSPYGISKLCAELIHKGWRQGENGRRLYICRPGVIYGPGETGNIPRMIRAVRKGYFVFPGSRNLRKSYAYIEGLLDSFEFIMAREENQLTYNYVERTTESLGTLVRLVQEHVGRRSPAFTAPLPLLLLVAAMAQLLTGGRSPLHPLRVRKTTLSTHIVPELLLKMGFPFRYDFASSLKDWARTAPEDFA
ncbi:MAG: NAD(P)-dependent oxidoreductase [Verrucomicrobiota bacterium]|jgi:nucleoside-diphosphate-sugar epimerase